MTNNDWSAFDDYNKGSKERARLDSLAKARAAKARAAKNSEEKNF